MLDIPWLCCFTILSHYKASALSLEMSQPRQNQSKSGWAPVVWSRHSVTVETDLVALMIAIIHAHTYLEYSSDPGALTCKSGRDDRNPSGRSAFLSCLGSTVTNSYKCFFACWRPLEHRYSFLPVMPCLGKHVFMFLCSSLPKQIFSKWVLALVFTFFFSQNMFRCLNCAFVLCSS